MFECTSVLKPCFEMDTLYVPIGKFAMLYDPSFCVVALTVSPVPRFFTCTEALITTAFVASVTVPLIEPSVCWAFVSSGKHAERISSRKIERLILCVISSPHPGRFSAFTISCEMRQAVLWISRRALDAPREFRAHAFFRRRITDRK